MASEALTSILSYLSSKYKETCRITTLEDMTMYDYIRNNVVVYNTLGNVVIDTKLIYEKLYKYTHPHDCITLAFEGCLDFYSKGLASVVFLDGNTYATLDLRKSNILKYSSAVNYIQIPDKRNE